MKRLFIYLFFFSLSIGGLFATTQSCDLLIVEKDTFCLKSFPLESVEFKTKPFKPAGTFCWRGYRAYWRILDNELYLEKILYPYPWESSVDIKVLFTKNDIPFKEKDGMILASWCTMKFCRKTYYEGKVEEIREPLVKSDKKKKNILLQIKRGKVVKNKLIGRK
ncbi:hypothetical protein D0T49_01665 [Paludibacter sp. 221]|uniref:hypothetical protein n=1 Tax=Paludibacter sp. 221 TaxID=2302939 RepID=UPI0013D2E4BC|nr:hypothetical protein [Paludibacter sp. 221]NDV45758.1 hypothetical protein [Paludibacter sp. 221]